MIRKIIKIDEDKCNGCGACAAACHEGAIEMIDGKAKLVREDYCDGLGDCLPACPADAISFEEREAPAYDEAAVLAAKKKNAARDRSNHPNTENNNTGGNIPCGCPGTNSRTIARKPADSSDFHVTASVESQLMQWPVQIKLAPVNAPYFENADLLIAADCTAYAYGNFHNEFIRNRITLIGCPKLDEGDYTDKLTAIIRENDIKSVTIVRMQVPCCGGLERAAAQALKNSGKFIPWRVVTVSTDGRIVE